MFRKNPLSAIVLLLFSVYNITLTQHIYSANNLGTLLLQNISRIKRNTENFQRPPIVNYLMKLNPLNVFKYHYTKKGFSPSNEYDFVVIGAGASGSVIASRLSENPNWTVLLLEAGFEESIVTDIPYYAFDVIGSKYTWRYDGIEDTGMCLIYENERCPLIRGRAIGGSTVINTMVYTRGIRKDFDDIAAAGNPGWAFDDIFPYYLKSEKANLKGMENTNFHNKSGLLSIELLRYRSRAGEHFMAAGKELGYEVGDYNTGEPFKFGWAQMNTEKGRRHSVSKAFLYPFRKRPNLHISPYSYVTKINIDPETKTAKSVSYTRFSKHKVSARKEIILSAGTLISPQLLMLSGIGPADHLQMMGINVTKDLKVGYNLRDHVIFSNNYAIMQNTELKDKIRYLKDRSLESFFRFLKDGSGYFAVAASQAVAFMNTNNSIPYPNVEILCGIELPLSIVGRSGYTDSANKPDFREAFFKPLLLDTRMGVTLSVMLLYLKSVGRIVLNSKNPYQPPKLSFPLLDEDIEALKDGIKLVLKIAETKAMQEIGAEMYQPILPGCKSFEFGSDDYWKCAVRYTTTTGQHHTGTCKMGPSSDPTAVVDNRLRVHGINRLRVADLSIIPTPFSPHMMAPAILIGEKLADMIKEDWKI